MGEHPGLAQSGSECKGAAAAARSSPSLSQDRLLAQSRICLHGSPQNLFVRRRIRDCASNRVGVRKRTPTITIAGVTNPDQWESGVLTPRRRQESAVQARGGKAEKQTWDGWECEEEARGAGGDSTSGAVRTDE
jgi:hypothetical protein